MSRADAERERLLLAPWTGMTLPGLAQGSATLRPDAPALVEADNTETLIGRKARLVSCKGLVTASDVLAHKLRALGVQPGDVVLTYLPNTSEALIALIGVQKAGGIPAPLPVFEPAERLVQAAAVSGAVAILTMDHFSGLRLAETAREAAVAALDIRLVAAFGADVPEGVASLDSWNSVEFLTTAPFPRLDGPDAALITFDSVGGPLRALIRSHEQLVAEAAATASLGRIATGTRLLSTLPPTSAAGVIFGAALPLLTGAWVELNPLFDSAGFAAQLGAGDKTTVILPGAAETAYRAFRGGRALKHENVVLVHRLEAGVPLPDLSGTSDNPRIIDVLAFGEAACLCSLRNSASAHLTLPKTCTYGVSGVLAPGQQAAVMSMDAAGHLCIAGALAPRLAGAGASAPIPTGLAVYANASHSLRLTQPEAASVSAA